MTTTSYPSLENIVIGSTPSGTINVGSCSPSAFPAYTWPREMGYPVTRTFEPYEEVRTLYDPTKGRKFKELRLKGEIVMSPYTNELETISRSISTRDHLRRFGVLWYASCPTPSRSCANTGWMPAYQSWTENDHIGSLSELFKVGSTLDSKLAEIPDMVSSTQQAAFVDALNAYDLLSEVGELNETLSYLMDKVRGGSALVDKFRNKDPDTYQRGRRMTPKSLLRSGDAALRKLGARWMEYRYALMPLLYSFKDISKVIEEKAYKYQSSRKKDKLVLDSFPGFELLPDDCLVYALSGSIEVRSLTKGRFDYGALQRLATVIGLNPFKTAWELLPLSFVVDWFLNVGDAITAFTGVDYASQRLGCTAVRIRATEEIFHHESRTGNIYLDFGLDPCGNQLPILDESYSDVYNNLVVHREINGYRRTLWNRPLPKLLFDPYLNWKRVLDGLVLGYQPVKKILRSLK